jgi:hypothetical protein
LSHAIVTVRCVQGASAAFERMGTKINEVLGPSANVKVPGSSRVPAPPGWAPDPLMVGIRSPDGLVVGSCTSHPGVWVRFPNERNQGKQAHPVLKYRVPYGSQREQLCTRSCSNKTRTNPSLHQNIQVINLFTYVHIYIYIRVCVGHGNIQFCSSGLVKRESLPDNPQ